MSGLNFIQTATGGAGFVDASSSAFAANAMCMSFAAARGATNTVIVGTLPANARIIAIYTQVSVVSNAATTATHSVGLSGGSATAFTAAQDVKAAVGNFSAAATAAWSPTATIQTITATYTETGTASTAGTINVNVLYCVN